MTAKRLSVPTRPTNKLAFEAEEMVTAGHEIDFVRLVLALQELFVCVWEVGLLKRGADELVRVHSGLHWATTARNTTRSNVC